VRNRAERVASLLLKEISTALREDIDHPDMGFFTLQRVEVSKDIKSARVFYSVIGSDEVKRSTDIAMHRSAKEIKRIVNDRVRMRYAVDLKFIREDSIEEAFRIQQIMDRIRDERESRERAGEAEPEAGTS